MNLIGFPESYHRVVLTLWYQHIMAPLNLLNGLHQTSNFNSSVHLQSAATALIVEKRSGCSIIDAQHNWRPCFPKCWWYCLEMLYRLTWPVSHCRRPVIGDWKQNYAADVNSSSVTTLQLTLPCCVIMKLFLHYVTSTVWTHRCFLI